MQKGKSTSAWAGERELLMWEGDPREQEKLWPSQLCSLIPPSGQDRVTNPKKLHAKISLFHKIRGGSETGVGVEGLPHGQLDNLDTFCFVLTLFQMSFGSLLHFKMRGHFYMTKVDCFHQKRLEMCLFCPQLGTDET